MIVRSVRTFPIMQPCQVEGAPYHWCASTDRNLQRTYPVKGRMVIFMRFPPSVPEQVDKPYTMRMCSPTSLKPATPASTTLGEKSAKIGRAIFLKHVL